MPNGGGTEDRIGAILGEAFVTRRKLSSGKRLPPGGRVDFVGERDLAADPDRTRPPNVELRFRVVSAAFDGLSRSERTSLIRDVLADAANPRSELNPHLGRVSIRLTGRAEGEFDFGYEVVVIEARTHSEAGEVEPRPKHALGTSENPAVALRPSRREDAATDGHHLTDSAQRQPPNHAPSQLFRSRQSSVSTEAGSSCQTAELRHLWVLWIVPAALLVIAILPLPYAYYTFLRLSVCAASAFLAYQHFVNQDAVDKWVVVLAAFALLYNPLIPVHLTREIWSVLNLVTAATFILHFVSVKRRLRNSDGS